MIKNHLPYLLVFFEQDDACQKFYENLNTDIPLLNKENQFHCEEVDSNILKIQASGEEKFYYNFYYTLAHVLNFDDYKIDTIKIEGEKGSSDLGFILIAGGIKKEKLVLSSSGESFRFKEDFNSLNDVLSKMKAVNT